MNSSNPVRKLVLLLVLYLLAGCDTSPRTLPVLRIGHAPHDHHAPLYVAAMNPSYFKGHGGVYLEEVDFQREYRLISDGEPVARVLIESGTGGKELIRRLAEEQFDLSMGGVPAMLGAIDKGRPIHILAPVMAEGAGLVMRSDFPADDWAAFTAYLRTSDSPVRIGYKSAVSVQNLIFEHALDEGGFEFSTRLDAPSVDVVLINLNGAKNLIPAMEGGLIDGFVVMQPFPAMAETRGVGKVVALLRDLPPEGRWHGYPCCALAATDSFVAAQPEIARVMVALIERAKQFIVEHPQESAEQVARWLGVDPAVEARSLPTIDFSVRFDDEWDRGVDFWVGAMSKTERLKGRVHEARATGRLQEVIYHSAVRGPTAEENDAQRHVDGMNE